MSMSLKKKYVVFSLLVFVFLSYYINIVDPLNYFFFTEVDYIILTGSILVFVIFVISGTGPIKFEFNSIDLPVITLFLYRIIGISIHEQYQLTSSNTIVLIV
jgi:Na+-translocating ferredoxin:NAD+ oxidoreductase RnfA subunit